MKTFVLLLILLTSLLQAEIQKATYDVSFGVFQKFGIANAYFETKENQTYLIRIEAKATGLAELLSNKRVEVYESSGVIQNGKLIPLKFVTIRQTKSKKAIKIYTFDHEAKNTWVEVTKNKVHHPKTQNPFYTPEDILSLFFNIKSYTKEQKNRSFHAISGNNDNGKIDVIFPKGEALAELKKMLGSSSGDFLKVILNDQIFASTNGELAINLNKDGLCDKAILEDVLFFGDIVGTRVP